MGFSNQVSFSDWNIPELCVQLFKWSQDSAGLDNGLMLCMQKPFTWTNDDPALWRII